MPSPRGFFSSGLPAQPIRPFTTKTFCARAALNRGLSRILSLSLLESEHSSFSFPAQSAHFGLCVVHGEGEHTNGDAKAYPCNEAEKSPQLLESVRSLRLRTWSGRFVVAFYRWCSGRCSQRRIEHHRPAQRFLTADWHTGFNVDLDARHDSAASTRAHRNAARLFA